MFDDILKVLEDGRWHDLTEIAGKVSISEDKVSCVAEFLSEFGFANINDEGKRVKLDSDFLNLPV